MCDLLRPNGEKNMLLLQWQISTSIRRSLVDRQRNDQRFAPSRFALRQHRWGRNRGRGVEVHALPEFEAEQIPEAIRMIKLARRVFVDQLPHGVLFK